MNREFWRGKRVLLTGHTGFKGSWLSLWLQELGARVVGYSLPPPTEPSLFELADVGQGMETVVGDIRNLDNLRTVFKRYQPEIVLHLAAQSLVGTSYVQPVDTYTTNVIGTVHVLEAARTTTGVRVLLNVTSDKCYDNQERIWGYREFEPMGGEDPYASSKGCAELVTAAYRASFFRGKQATVAVASARAGNAIGGGDWAEHRLIPDLIRSIERKAPLGVRNPDSIRPWQHVLEPLSGYLLAERLWQDRCEFAESWNFGPNDDDARSVRWIIERLIALWGEGASWNIEKAMELHEADYLRLDSLKARTLLGWRPAGASIAR